MSDLSEFIDDITAEKFLLSDFNHRIVDNLNVTWKANPDKDFSCPTFQWWHMVENRWINSILPVGKLYYKNSMLNVSYKIEMGATKHDSGKLPLELLPFEALEEVGKVLKFGAEKYDAHNWRKGFIWSRLIGAALRHVFSFAKGEDKDPETGLSHLAHACCCILFLLSFTLTNNGNDDRVKICT